MYWLGDSSVSMLQSNDGRFSKKRQRDDAVSMAWDELAAKYPSENRGGRGQQLVERVGATPSLVQSVGNLVRRWHRQSAGPRAVIMSSGYNRLQEDDATTIAETLAGQLMLLHDKFPRTPLILLGLAVDADRAPDQACTAAAVMSRLHVFAQGKESWLTVIPAETWLQDARRQDGPIWEDDSVLHLTARARCELLRVVGAELQRRCSDKQV